MYLEDIRIYIYMYQVRIGRSLNCLFVWVMSVIDKMKTPNRKSNLI